MCRRFGIIHACTRMYPSPPPLRLRAATEYLAPALASATLANMTAFAITIIPHSLHKRHLGL
jgi:hypothetical protein